MSNADERAQDLRHLIVCDTQFGWSGATTLKLPEIERLVARGWVAEGDENAEYDVTDAGRTAIAAALNDDTGAAFQSRVAPWMQECFGASIASDVRERGDRLLEEVLELLQSHGYDPARVDTLRDYVFGRPAGEPQQEVGGAMVTLAAYCLATGIDMHAAGDTELARISEPEVVERIRVKQSSKRGLHTPLPTPPEMAAGATAGDGASLIGRERQRQVTAEGWSAAHDDAYGKLELVRASVAYALYGVSQRVVDDSFWPWHLDWWKPSDRVRNLVKAGALIAAEIDRLHRADTMPQPNAEREAG